MYNQSSVVVGIPLSGFDLVKRSASSSAGRRGSDNERMVGQKSVNLGTVKQIRLHGIFVHLEWHNMVLEEFQRRLWIVGVKETLVLRAEEGTRSFLQIPQRLEGRTQFISTAFGWAGSGRG